ncbi:MAG TPA: sigma-70 family RNA polymerase sigma factor [Chitinivibrionales bacterium]|nr:sigma-70 family RNA polymerase sigma factor [Chitinivibrionales bacterium]
MDDTGSQDNDLVLRSQRGETDALRKLLISNSRLIQSVTARMTRNPQMQEDIFQEVAMRVVRGIKEFKGNCKFSTWLYRITVNVALTILVKEGGYKKTVALEDVPEHALKREQTIEDSVDRDRAFGEIRSAVLEMSPKNREVFSLFYFADASIDEIAAQTGMHSNGIKAILFKGRKTITKHLRKKGLLDLA